MAETMSNQVGDPYDPYTCMSHSSDRHNRRARLSPKNASKVSADAAGASLVSGGAVKDSNTAHFPISPP